MGTTVSVRHLLSFLIIFSCSGLLASAQQTDTFWFAKIDLNRFTQDWNLTPKPTLENGLAARTENFLRFDLNGNAEKFHTSFSLSDAAGKRCRVTLRVIADDKEVYKTPVLRRGSKPVDVNVNLQNVKRLFLIIEDNGTGVYLDRAHYANAFIAHNGNSPTVYNYNYINKRHILTPAESPQPKINSAKVFGVRPGNPFLYRIAATGNRPMTFAVENLPQGLSVDSLTGIITGVLQQKGESSVTLKATNALGTATRELKIVAGDRIALTPPMGWNGYNRYGDSVDDAIVRASVDAIISSGLVNHGWDYINIDDSWSVRPGSTDPVRGGETRDANGMINANKKFPDMKGLTDYIHAKGFKAGIYSSPSTVTCTGYTATYGYEEQDARRWADWGFDYLKYDYCSYNKIANSESLETMQKPYIIMRKALDKVKRDIVFSFSQYGGGDVWKWGDSIGGNSWRTTGDLIDTWSSVSEIGFTQAGIEKYAGPGHWNDPDMLVVGLLGWGEVQYPTRLIADEQYSHLSLWSLLSSPLLIGCDIIYMDEFTRSLLTNDEVIEINQDPLGIQAARIYQKDSLEIWSKKLEDGSTAVGLFNRNATAKKIKAEWNTLGLSGKQILRDVWRQKDEGSFSTSFSAVVPAHGVKLIRIRPKQ